MSATQANDAKPAAHCAISNHRPNSHNAKINHLRRSFEETIEVNWNLLVRGCLRLSTAVTNESAENGGYFTAFGVHPTHVFSSIICSLKQMESRANNHV